VYGDAQVYGDAWEKSPLQIQGTRHFVNICKIGYIQIGCLSLSFENWKKSFSEIGKKEGYTEKQIKEYEIYINLIIDMYPITKTV
jgi:hypothetical protein